MWAVAALVMHRQRGLERVREVAGVTACLLRLLLGVREELVDLLGERQDLGREIRPSTRLVPDRISATSPAHAAQRATVRRRSAAPQEQADAERREAPEQGQADLVNLLVDGCRAIAPPGIASLSWIRAE